MGNTTTINGHVIRIIPDGSTDWYMDQDLPNSGAGLALHSIVFKPSGTNDVLVVRDSKRGTASTAEIVAWKVGGDTEEQVIYLEGEIYNPFIDDTDCTYSSAAAARIMFHFK